jgi:hypothetical protein
VTRAATPHPGTEILGGPLAPAAPNVVQLLLARSFRPEPGALLRALREAVGQVDELAMAGIDDSWAFAYPRPGIDEPSSHLVSKVDLAAIQPGFEPALQQTWGWPAAREVVARSGAAIALSDRATGDLKERLALFQRVVRVLIVQFPVVAIHWLASQRIVDPVAYLEPDPKHPLLQGPVNVRMFRVENSDRGEIVMDTLGLAPLGLPDLEHRYSGVEPNLVAPRLFQYAHYLYERGEVIPDGHTVDGVLGRWTCRVRGSSVGPARRMLAFVEPEQLPAEAPRAVACPACGWHPDAVARWACDCGFTWNTFGTRGRCPACAKQWTETRCLRCHAMSSHSDWYG